MAIEASSGLVNEMAKVGGKSFADCFANSYIKIFTLPRPTDADQVETGTLLGTLTVSAGAFSPGSPTNGLNFGLLTAAGKIAKAAGEDWEFEAVASGEAGWYRHYGNAVGNEGADTTDDPEDRSKIRYDGSISTSDTADMVASSTTVTSGKKVSLDDYAVTIPKERA